MSLVVFKYCLPLALGYLVFAAVSGRSRPWPRPTSPIERPAWFLGLWQGSAITVALGSWSHIASHYLLYEVLDYVKPLIGTTLLVMLAGVVLALVYQQRIAASAVQQQADTGAGGPVTDRDPAVVITPDPPRAIPVAADRMDTTAALEALRQDLQAETQLRIETETHLRITRKALHSLESQARDHEAARTDAMIGLEEQLEEQIRQSARVESNLQREREKVTMLELGMVSLKQELLVSRCELRRSLQARTRAMATARKALDHARRALHGRVGMETRIRELQTALVKRQRTITSLIKALEIEKNRNEEQVSERARQLMLHQEQLRARRAVEVAAGAGGMRAGSRLIKRIARARRIEGSAN